MIDQPRSQGQALSGQDAPGVPAPDTVVFIPAWNEERSLPAVLAEFMSMCVNMAF